MHDRNRWCASSLGLLSVLAGGALIPSVGCTIRAPTSCVAWSAEPESAAGSALLVRVYAHNDCWHDVRFDPSQIRVRASEPGGGRIWLPTRATGLVTSIRRRRSAERLVVVDASEVGRRASLCLELADAIPPPDVDRSCQELTWSPPGGREERPVHVAVDATLDGDALARAASSLPPAALEGGYADAPAAPPGYGESRGGACADADLELRPAAGDDLGLHLAVKNHCDASVSLDPRAMTLTVVTPEGAQSFHPRGGAELAITPLPVDATIDRDIRVDAAAGARLVCANLLHAISPGPGPEPICVRVPPEGASGGRARLHVDVDVGEPRGRRDRSGEFDDFVEP